MRNTPFPVGYKIIGSTRLCEAESQVIERLFVVKKFGNYADTFLMLGLAQLAEFALKETEQKSEIQLIDQGIRYCIQFKKAVNLEPIAKTGVL